MLVDPSTPVAKEFMEDDDLVEWADPVDPIVPDTVPRDIAEMDQKRKPAWVRQTLQDAEGHATPCGAFRESKRPQSYECYVALMSSILDSEPSTYAEVASQQCWKDAMMEEYESIMKNDVWEIVSRPDGKSVVTSKWIFKIKHAANGSIEKYKAKFLARGFSQKEGVDYDETFAPVARYTSIRTIIALASAMRLRLHQMDVKTAFLNGEIEEEVHVEQPDGFVVHGKESDVCRLKKALYGLKQAPRAWYGRIDGFLVRLGFTKNVADSNLYYKVVLL